MREVKFDKLALLFLEDLANLLIDKEYFSFAETADNYIDDLVVFILNNIHTLKHKPAPSHFVKYGKGMFYISYNRSNRTSWYIFFEKTDYHYLIRYITNNHVSGQYF